MDSRTKVLGLCATLLLLTGCMSVMPYTKQGAEPELAAESLVAQDMFKALLQIDELQPWSTGLIIRYGLDAEQSAHPGYSATAAFGRALKLTALARGFKVYQALTGDATLSLDYSVTKIADVGTGAIYNYGIRVQGHRFNRMYKQLNNGLVEPYRPMIVSSANAGDAQANDSANYGASRSLSFNSPFERFTLHQNQKPVHSAATPLANSVRLESLSVPKGDDSLKSNKHSIDSTADQEQALVVEKSESVVLNKSNLAEIGQSNFSDLFSTKSSVVEQTLVFKNDSFILGRYNKKLLNDMLISFNPTTDVISVVGCSTGHTKLKNGNAALAIGRANRVKEALLRNGIANSKILDEGCWSPSASSTPFPNRGVVVTIKRGE